MAVCVTGASGFIASHVVKQLLEKGHRVHGTVRDATNTRKVAHLLALPGAERLTLFSAELMQDSSYDEAVRGCEVVFHMASPLEPGKGFEDPEALVVAPAVEGTLNVLRSCRKAGTVKRVVITSSMSAVAPVPEPPVKSEEHWSDPEEQQERCSFYGASKTLAERAAYDFVAEKMPRVRISSICPTMVLGPMLQADVNMTMGVFRNWLKNGVPRGKCRNDSMSFVDVRDCAAQHLATMELEKDGRFMSLDRSLHWNDLSKLMKEIYPAMPPAEPCDGEPCKPTQFDRRRMESLKVPVRALEEVLKEAADELRRKGEL